jgi:NAD(P)-dependent dehydrogenase (short-subunit alcohol dehydrogenase family)
MAVACNVSHRDQLERLVADVMAEWQRIDILVCNAAVNPHFGSLMDISDEAYDKIMTVNVKNTLWLCRLVIPRMTERKDGVVIVVSSIAGFKGSRNLGTYAISKAADMQLVRNLALECAGDNVRVNGIAPGLVRTAFSRALWENPENRARALESYPLGRLGEPEDIAGAAVFLASAAGRWVTGQTLVIDGGAGVSAGRYS